MGRQPYVPVRWSSLLRRRGGQARPGTRRSDRRLRRRGCAPLRLAGKRHVDVAIAHRNAAGRLLAEYRRAGDLGPGAGEVLELLEVEDDALGLHRRTADAHEREGRRP